MVQKKMTKLNLTRHNHVLIKQVSHYQWTELFSDVRIICQDGEVRTHRMILCSMSPSLREIFLHEDHQEDPTLILPDVLKEEMTFLLALLYNGTVNLYKKELNGFVSLTQLLKMVSIPVALKEEKWSVRYPGLSQKQPTENSTKPKDVAPQPSSSAQSTTESEEDSTPEGEPQFNLPTRTRSGRVIVPKKFNDDVIVGEDEQELHDEEDGDEEEEQEDVEEQTEEQPVEMITPDTEDQQSFSVAHSEDGTTTVIVTSSDFSALAAASVDEDGFTEYQKRMGINVGRSKRGRPRDPDSPQKETKHLKLDGDGVVQDAEALDNLISVAEAFERSRQPDFHDIASPAVEGTDTEKLLMRNCVLCKKQVLGRNAYGRHMKNSHPKVLGPYTCPQPDCNKNLEDGMKVMQHMHVHNGPRARASADGHRYECTQCNAQYTTSSRLNEHLRRKHGVNEGYTELKFQCNAGDENCKEVFSVAKKFIEHMLKTHNMYPWYCESCNKRFKERQNYQYHLMSHDGARNFVCDICKKAFSNPRQLYCHRALHMGKRFLCPTCGYRARSSANLRGHIKAKHEGKQFMCQYCFKKFGSGNNLKNHLRIHTGETPFECNLCGVKFKRMHHLHSHIESKIHTDIMEKFKRKGYEIPKHLDPNRRPRGRSTVEDGPVLKLLPEEDIVAMQDIDGQITTEHGQLVQIEATGETHQVIEDPFSGQSMVVIEEQPDLGGGVGTYIIQTDQIPVEGGTVEIIEGGEMMAHLITTDDGKTLEEQQTITLAADASVQMLQAEDLTDAS